MLNRFILILSFVINNQILCAEVNQQPIHSEELTETVIKEITALINKNFDKTDKMNFRKIIASLVMVLHNKSMIAANESLPERTPEQMQDAILLRQHIEIFKKNILEIFQTMVNKYETKPNKISEIETIIDKLDNIYKSRDKTTLTEIYALIKNNIRHS